MFFGRMALTSPILWHLSLVCQIAVQGIRVSVIATKFKENNEDVHEES
jgi:hypothetical protein